jgi:ferredoxin
MPARKIARTGGKRTTTTKSSKKSAKKTARKKKKVKKAVARNNRTARTAGSSAASVRPLSGPSKRAAQKRSWLLNIDYSLCKGCGGCAEAFPLLFEMRDERAWIINAHRYDEGFHGGVRTICPYYAISVVET